MSETRHNEITPPIKYTGYGSKDYKEEYYDLKDCYEWFCKEYPDVNIVSAECFVDSFNYSNGGGDVFDASLDVIFNVKFVDGKTRIICATWIHTVLVV